jgi:predicted Zn finger-like uncharacterized protein
MYTQCPQCRTIFEISEDALQASLGIVRCGHCAERFDALRTLSDTLPVTPGAALPEHDPEALAPTLTAAVSPEDAQAAQPARRRAPEPALPGGESATAQAGEAWVDALSADRARALIADAAGIPPEAVPDDPAWQLTDLPVQASFAELGVLPLEADALPPEPVAPDPPGLANAGAAESEPFTDAWGLDIPDIALAELAAAGEPATSREEDLAAVDAARPEFADDTGDDPLADAAEPDPGAWLPQDPFRYDDALPRDADAHPDAVATPAEIAEEAATDAEPAGTAEPVYVPPRRRRVHRSDWLWATGCVVLALALAAQVAWASRVALVRDPATQAQALRVCARLDCRLPPIRDTAKLELLSRDVRPDPDAAGALAITATFRNNAPYRQPWPLVVVELTDLDNNVVAMRRFRPAEYMPDAARRNAGIAAGTTVAVAFEVADPGKRAVSFHFGFD